MSMMTGQQRNALARIAEWSLSRGECGVTARGRPGLSSVFSSADVLAFQLPVRDLITGLLTATDSHDTLILAPTARCIEQAVQYRVRVRVDVSQEVGCGCDSLREGSLHCSCTKGSAPTEPGTATLLLDGVPAGAVQILQKPAHTELPASYSRSKRHETVSFGRGSDGTIFRRLAAAGFRLVCTDGSGLSRLAMVGTTDALSCQFPVSRHSSESSYRANVTVAVYTGGVASTTPFQLAQSRVIDAPYIRRALPTTLDLNCSEHQDSFPAVKVQLGSSTSAYPWAEQDFAAHLAG